MNFSNIILGENDAFLSKREVGVIPDEKQTITHIVPEKFRDDVAVLTAYIGEENFKSGLCIDVQLSEILSILPRQRRRADAYDALRKYLKTEQNITLTVKSNRKL